MAVVGAGARIAGRGGMGEGERPRPGATLNAGEAAPCCEENDERRELGLCAEPGGGGFIVLMFGVDGTEMLLGVGGG